MSFARVRAVAGKELTVLWTSPVPYVVGALFQAVLAALFVDQLHAREQAVVQPLFPLAGFLLLLTVPIITMRSFAEEARTGTLDLLQAAPVPPSPLVAGKWLAGWLTTLAMLLPTGVLVVIVRWLGHPDRGPVIAGYVGLALLAATLTGVGVLASSLTSSQPVAAMVAVFGLLLLWFSNIGSGTLNAGDVLAHFSLSERLRSFAGGAIDTSDVGFLVAAVVVTLAVTALVVDSRRLR